MNPLSVSRNKDRKPTPGFHAVLQRIDNEISKKMIADIERSGIEIEIAAPGNHRANPAERAIQALKSHMISKAYQLEE